MPSPSSYQQIFPNNDNLKSYIKLYYFQQSIDEGTIEEITYYPNYVTTINIYQNSKLTWDDYSRTHQYSVCTSLLKLLVGKFDRSRKITMNGQFNKLTIVFHPLGLNHFIDAPLSSIIKDNFSLFDYFDKSFDLLLAQVFKEDNIEQKRNLLDNYFTTQFIGFEDQRMIYAVDQILASNGQVSIQQLAEDLKISRKTLLRLFRKHMAMSPAEYKSIVKFRTALHMHQNKQQKSNLSSLAYEANYYDQSDLNFNFKEKTGLTPKQLFSQIQAIDKDLYWTVDVNHVPKVQD